MNKLNLYGSRREEMDEQNQVFRAAEDAKMWLDEETDEDLFDNL